MFHKILLAGLLTLSLAAAPGAYALNAKTVERPHVPDGFEAGVNLYVHAADYKDRSDLADRLDAVFDRLIDDHVNAISLVWPIYTGDVTSSQIFHGPGTPSYEDLGFMASAATMRGFIVTLRPIIDERSIMNKQLDWRGTIRPGNVDQWFAEYSAIMLPYASLAEDVNAYSFIIGVELNSMEKYTAKWSTLIAGAREAFGGKLSYSGNQGFNRNMPWEELDYVGIDAFFELTTPDFGATADDMLKSAQTWVEWTQRVVAPVGLPIVLAEVGSASQQNAHKKSWLWNHNRVIDLEDQRAYYEAMCKAWRPIVRGIYWWNFTLVQPLDAASDGSFTSWGKPAEVAMAACYEN